MISLKRRLKPKKRLPRKKKPKKKAAIPVW
jgi:hypothetical protein